MWLKESCVASVRCHYGGQHTPSPAADIKARKARLGSAYAHPTHGPAPSGYCHCPAATGRSLLLLFSSHTVLRRSLWDGPAGKGACCRPWFQNPHDGRDKLTLEYYPLTSTCGLSCEHAPGHTYKPSCVRTTHMYTEAHSKCKNKQIKAISAVCMVKLQVISVFVIRLKALTATSSQMEWTRDLTVFLNRWTSSFLPRTLLMTRIHSNNQMNGCNI